MIHYLLYETVNNQLPRPSLDNKNHHLQQKLREVTGSTAALQTWQPHLTIGDGIEISNEQLAVVETKLKQVAKQAHIFPIALRGFDGFTQWKPGAGQTGTPYVIYTRVEPSRALTKLVQDINDVIADENRWYRMPRPYKSHITLAYRDLDEAGFIRGMNYLASQSFDHNATIDHIALAITQDESNSELRRIRLTNPRS